MDLWKKFLRLPDLWIMSPNPQFPKDRIPAILEQLAKTGYNVKDIVYVEHGKK